MNFKSHLSQIQFKCWKDKCLRNQRQLNQFFETKKNVISRLSMAKIKRWCKRYWWLSWKETNLFLVVYSPLFQCSLQGCWTGIQFLEFINHSQKWPPHGSIYSAFCKVFIMSPEFDSKHFRLMAQLHWLQKWPWFFFSDLLNGQK